MYMCVSVTRPTVWRQTREALPSPLPCSVEGDCIFLFTPFPGRTGVRWGGGGGRREDTCRGKGWAEWRGHSITVHHLQAHYVYTLHVHVHVLYVYMCCMYTCTSTLDCSSCLALASTQTVKREAVPENHVLAALHIPSQRDCAWGIMHASSDACVYTHASTITGKFIPSCTHSRKRCRPKGHVKGDSTTRVTTRR